MSVLRVLLAVDHIPTRDGIRGALEDHGLVVCAEVEDGPAAVLAAIELVPDVCILGVRIPGDGIAAVRRITQALPHTRVVVLADSEHGGDLFDALRAGAAGYLFEDTDPARLGFAIEGVAKGEAAIPRQLVTRILQELRDPSNGAVAPGLRARGIELSNREWQVISLMHARHTTKAIARRLGLADVTVRRHVSRALAKLGAPDRAAAIRLLDEIEADASSR